MGRTARRAGGCPQRVRARDHRHVVPSAYGGLSQVRVVLALMCRGFSCRYDPVDLTAAAKRSMARATSYSALATFGPTGAVSGQAVNTSRMASAISDS
jgi:hypothetical protein